MKYKFFALIILVPAMLIINACRPGTQSSESEDSSEMIGKEEIKAGLEEVAYPLPEPFEVYGMLEEIGATYLSEIMNPVSNSEKYITQKSKALAVGIYAADLGYAVTYANQDDMKSYSITLKSLVDDLGVHVDYSELQDEEVRQQLADKDSLVAYVSEVFYDTYSFLSRESTPALAGLMAAGAWTEGLYIATHISDDTYNNTDIVKIIFEQGESLESLIGLLKKFENEERVKSLLGAFLKLQALYNEAGESLTEEQLEGITTTIETIRESIIS